MSYADLRERIERVADASPNLPRGAIEGVLERHPAVESCCVVGEPHADLGEVPVAFVRPRPGAAVGARELDALVARHLSKAHVPVRTHFVETLPENAAGKVDRAALRRRIAPSPTPP